ncbi:MAG: tetratricopeptide repeat protein [Gemmatimonadetes bacterium]|nr:tetratricopeptide repeat protein [Gemmatimonadota bacterium]
MRHARVLFALLAALAAPAGARAQQPARDSTGYLLILEPKTWIGEGTRGVAVAPPPGELRIVGRVYHPAGIAQVLVNATPAVLQPDANGAMRFSATVVTDTISEVTIVATTGAGTTIVKDYSWAGAASAAPGAPASAANPAAPGAPAGPPPVADSAGARPQPVLDSAGAPTVLAADEGPQRFVQIREPREWAGGIRAAPLSRHQSIRIVGLAMTPTGVSRVLINGDRAAVQRDESGAFRFTGYVRPDTATHEVEVVVQGQPGTAPLVRRYPVAISTDTAAAAAPHGPGGYKGERWAVVVGISRYADATIPSLRYADSDARAFYELLRSDRVGLGGFKADHVKLLLNQDATHLNIRSALFTFLKAATEDDQVVIYFAGHGAPDPQRLSDLYLLTYDTKGNDISGTAFPMDAVTEAVKKLRARDVVVITDACHSAGVGGQLATRDLGLNQVNQAFLDQLNASSGGLVVFTASRASELSQEGEQWGGGHGVFTYFLLEALKGAADADGDRIVTLDEMMEYTRDKVRRATVNAQTPSISQTAYDPALPMSLVLDSAAAAAADLAAASAASAAVAAASAEPAPPTPTPSATPPGAPDAGAARSTAKAAPAGEDGIAPFRQAVARAPNNAVFHRNLGEALLKAGRTRDAMLEYQAAVRLDPRSALYHNGYGVLLRQLGMKAEAVDQLGQALRLEPGNVAYAADYALALLTAGQFDAAVDQYRKLLKADPGTARYHDELGQALVGAGKRDDAADEFRRAIQLDPASAAAHVHLAGTLRDAGRRTDALVEFREAARIEPNNVDVRLALVGELVAEHRAEDAIAELKQLVALQPTNARLHHELGVLLRDNGMGFEAVGELRAAVKLDTTAAAYHHDLGEALVASGLKKEALTERQAAARLEPDEPKYRFALGVSLFEDGQFTDAVPELRQAARLAPTRTYYRFVLASALTQMNLLNEALATLQDVVKQEPKNKQYSDALKELKKRMKK